MRLLATLAALPLIACSYSSDDGKPGIPGTGSGNSRSYQVADFSEVALRGSDDVDVRTGGAFAVRAAGDPEVLEYLKIEKDGDTLKIGRRNRSGFNWGKRSVKVFVTMPQIADGSVAGSGSLAIDKVAGRSFSANAAGSGSIAVAALDVEAADLNIAGSGDIAAGGTARSVKANIAGSGNVSAERLAASAADISIAGSGAVKMAVNGQAKVSIMGSGSANLGPNATCSVSKMGSGSVTCGK